VLAAALENGISQSKPYSSKPGRFTLPGGQSWSVKNSTEGNGGRPMALREATAKSVNAVFARLVLDVGADKVVATAKKMGITSPLDAFPSIALGGLRIGVSPLEMASAYGTLANEGQHVEPMAITKITDASGKILDVAKIQPQQVISRTTAYLVTDILKNVIRSGTGRRANIGRPAAGKTGTTQNYHDAWFAGYTPQLSTAVWVGYSNKQKPMYSVHGMKVAGGTFPAQIWARFMSSALAGKPREDFDRPTKGLIQVKLCVESDKLARSYCPETYIATFTPKQKPTQLCDIHTTPPPVTVPSFTGLRDTDAIYLAEKMGFAVAKTYQQVDKNPGIVVSQSPKAGSVAKQGDTIALTITMLKPPLPKVPDVTGMSRGDAEGNLSRAGFVVIIKEQPGDPSQLGKVLSQSPQSGTAQSGGSTVTIVVGSQ
jgi:penicillin-binding protein 1A